MLIDSSIKMLLECSFMLDVEDTFCDALDGKGSKEELQDRFMKQQWLVDLCIDLIIDHKQTELDWKYVHDNGLLCKKAYEWFGKELKEAGVEI